MSPLSYTVVGFLVFCAVNIDCSKATCFNVSPPTHFSLSSAMGSWYVYRSVSPYLFEESESQCQLVVYTPFNETAFGVNSTTPGIEATYRINDQQQPWKWGANDNESRMMIIYQAPDNSKLVMTTCRPDSVGKGYILLTRRAPIPQTELDEIERIVDTVGVSRVDDSEEYHTWQCTATCPAV